MPPKGAKRKDISSLDDSGVKKQQKNSSRKKKKSVNKNNSGDCTGKNPGDENCTSVHTTHGTLTMNQNTNNVNNHHQQQYSMSEPFHMFSHGPPIPYPQQQFCSSPTTNTFPVPGLLYVSPVTNTQNPSWVDELFRRMDNFDRKLNKLEQIDKIVTTINAKVVSLEEGSKSLDARLEQVERCTQLVSDDYDQQKSDVRDLKKEVERYTKRVGEDFNKQKGNLTELKKETDSIKQALQVKNNEERQYDDEVRASLTSLKKENVKLRESVIEFQMKTMSNNLMFYNIPENEGEICTTVIADFLKNTLKLENADEISITEGFRIGKKGPNIRPILVKFQSTEHRDRVKSNAKNLKGSAFGISEQLPVEVQSRRKELLPVLKNLRDQEIKAYFVRDKIFVDGREYKP